jgi:hypothetical protein
MQLLILVACVILTAVNAGPPVNLPNLPNLFKTVSGDVDNYTSTVTGNIPDW